MQAFNALVRKDLILFLSDRRALIVSLLLPIMIASFFGYLFGGAGKNAGGPIDLALVQLDTSATGARIGAGLAKDPSLRVTPMTLEAAREQVRKGKQKVAVVIPAGFGDAAGAALFGAGDKPAMTLLYDPSQQAVLSMVKGMLTQQVMETVSGAMLGGAEGEAFTDKTLARLEQANDPQTASLKTFMGSLKTFQQGQRGAPAGGAGGMSTPFSTSDEAVGSAGQENGYNAYAHSFAGMGVQFILFMGVDIGIGVLLAQRSGIWQRLLAAPVTLRTILLARTASAALIAACLLLIIFGFAMLVFGVRVSNWGGFVGVVLCFALLTASFGLLIAAFGKTPEAARGIAIFATLIMVMLGGAWVPSFLFPEWVQQVSLAVPTRWAIDGLDAMTWRGLGWDAALASMGVQLAFTLVFGLLALWQFGRDEAPGHRASA